MQAILRPPMIAGSSGRARGAARARPRGADFLQPTAPEIGVTAALLLAYLGADNLLSESGILLVNEVGPYLFAGTLLAASLWMARVTPHAIWTPLFWYRLSTAVFFGIGNVAHTWMNWYSLAYYNTFHSVTDADLAKFNVIVAASHLGVLITVRVGAGLSRPTKPHVPIASHRRILKLATIGCCLIGYSVKYFVVLPTAIGLFGAIDETVVPNTIAQLQLLAPAGLFLLAISARWEGRLYAIAAALLLMTDLLFGCITLSKYTALLPLLTYLLAFLFGRTTLPRAAIAAFVLVVSFITMQPMIEFGRGRISQAYGDILHGSLAERFDLFVEYWTQDTPRDEELQGSLLRIAYLNVNAASMELFDTGRPGTSIGAISWIFIPRLLWPEKPLYAIGAEFSGIVQGTESSQTWMGYFGEAYYNFGYWGLLTTIPLGMIFVFVSRYAVFVLETRRWLHLPSVFLGLTMGTQTDTSLIGVAVAFVSLLALHLISNVTTTMIQRLLASPKASTVTRHGALGGGRAGGTVSRQPALLRTTGQEVG